MDLPGWWIDLLDPDESELLAALPPTVGAPKLGHLLELPRTSRQLRPRLEAVDHHLEGVLLAARRRGEELVIQEIHVIANPELLVIVRKTPAGGEAFDTAPLAEWAAGAAATGTEPVTPGMALYRLMDEIAEDYLDLIDEFDAAIDQLEDEVEDLDALQVRDRISQLRHDLLHVRRVLAPTRDEARSILDGRLDLALGQLFPREVELHFADVYDKLLRCMDGLELARDLLAGVRDYHQAQVAHAQNEVTKRLTAIASILLVPTFIVGLYGQNFPNLPELSWRWGYAFSWALIVVSTAGQVWWFRRRKWL